jgi:hypothetical protein
MPFGKRLGLLIIILSLASSTALGWHDETHIAVAQAAGTETCSWSINHLPLVLR